MTWVYIPRTMVKLARSEYAVGFFAPPTGDERPDTTLVWYEVKVLQTEREAQRLVSYLNGGHA